MNQQRVCVVLLTGALLGVAGGPGASLAYGQASGTVRMYGRVVAGLNYQSNLDSGRLDQTGRPIVASSWGIDGNVWGTNLLGFAGSQSLGDGLHAQFVLESGFEAATGRITGGNGIWTRRAIVGLSGGFGTLRIGRSLSLPTEVIWSLDPSGQQAVGAASLVKGRSWPTNNNQVDYISPSIGGLTVQGVYGFGEAASSRRESRTGGVSLAYLRPNYELRAMYDVANDPRGQYSELFRYSKELTLGGTMTLGRLKLLGGFQRLSAPAVVTGPDHARHMWFGANYWAGQALMLIGGVYHVRLNKSVGNAKLFMLGANYYLSKHTLLYISSGKVRNNSQTDFAVETYGGAAGRNQTAFYTGIAHSF